MSTSKSNLRTETAPSASPPEPLNYESAPAPSPLRSLLTPFRFAAFVITVAAGTYISTIIRGWGPGSALPGLFCVSGFVALYGGLLPLLGMRWRYYIAALITLVIIPAVIADAYCTLEEKVFVVQAKKLPPTAQTLFTSRWWPNGNSYLYYEPSTGEFGGGD